MTDMERSQVQEDMAGQDVTAEAAQTDAVPVKPKESFCSSFFDIFEVVVLTICIVILAYTLLGRVVRVDGSSMRNTLYDGEMLITTSLVTPEPGDIVVFHLTSSSGYNEPLVKRVIATEGQTVRIDYISGQVSVDGQVLDEPYACLLDQYGREIDRWTQVPGHSFDYMTGVFEATVPEGCYFVMGDNRNNSADSRSRQVGFVDARRVLGKVILRTKPLETFD